MIIELGDPDPQQNADPQIWFVSEFKHALCIQYKNKNIYEI